jgi:excisionase family DNA binding protein
MTNGDDPLLDVPEALEFTGLSRTGLYAFLRSGRVKAVKIGYRTKFRRSELQRFIEALPEAEYLPSCYSGRAAQEAAGASAA